MLVVMRTALALAMSFLLLSVITACPLLACPLKADVSAAPKSCCHKPHSHPLPCEQPAAKNCPYLVLERGKASPIQSQAVAAGLVPNSPDLHAILGESTVPSHGRIPDSAGLYLRIRVLLV